VSVCSPFKLLIHLTDGHEKWYEDHVIGVHPNMHCLIVAIIHFGSFLLMCWYNSRMANHRYIREICK